MQFLTSSDRELWVYHIGEFRFPVYATPGDVNGEKHWRVVCAVFLRPTPFEMLSGVLNPVAVNRYSGFWVIHDSNFKAEKATGITPDHYKHLPDDPPRPVKTRVLDLVEELRNKDPDFKPADDFIRDVWQRTAICELTTLRLIWLTLCQEMPRWMLQTHKPVDLGWARVCVFPFRMNWKQILLGKFPNIWSLLILSKQEREAKLELSDFKDEATSTDMAALSKAGPTNRTVRWTVELDPNNQWWDYQDQVEKRVFEGTTKGAYLKRYASLLHQFYPKAVEVFRNWVHQTTIPSAAVLARRSGSIKQLVDHVHPGTVHARNPEGLPVFVTTNARGISIRDSSKRKLVACETPDMPEMPIVDFQSRDMRDAWGDDERSDNGNEKTAGMLVQHEAGGEASKETMLGACEPTGHRLAGQPES